MKRWAMEGKLQYLDKRAIKNTANRGRIDIGMIWKKRKYIDRTAGGGYPENVHSIPYIYNNLLNLTFAQKNSTFMFYCIDIDVNILHYMIIFANIIQK